MNKHEWTFEEQKTLMNCIKEGESLSEIIRKIKLSRETIKRHIYENAKLKTIAEFYGFPHKRERKWTEKEIDFIAKNIHMDVFELAEALKRSVFAVRKAISVNYIRIRNEAFDLTIDLERQIDDLEREMEEDGDISEERISKKNRLLCAIEERKNTCEGMKKGLIKTFAILK